MKMDENGYKWKQMVKNGPIDQNGPKWPKMLQNGKKMIKKVQTAKNY